VRRRKSRPIGFTKRTLIRFHSTPYSDSPPFYTQN
jgi:hypothetical protein